MSTRESSILQALKEDVKKAYLFIATQFFLGGGTIGIKVKLCQGCEQTMESEDSTKHACKFMVESFLTGEFHDFGNFWIISYILGP